MNSVLVGPLPVPSQVGDAAIAAGAIVLLRQAFPTAEIRGWSSCSELAKPRVLQSFLHTYNVDAVVYSPATRGFADIGGAMTKYSLPPLARLTGHHALRLPLGAVREIAEAIADADLVVMRGGGYLSSPHLLCDLWGLRLDSLNELAIAHSLSVPYAIWGHTIWDLNGPLSKRILWPLIRDSAVTVCREQRSYDYLVAAGAPTDRLTVLPDTAFALRPVPEHRSAEIIENEGLGDVGAPLIGVNVRPPWDVNADYDELTPRYLRAMAAAIEHMHRAHGTHALLVSHCHSTDLHHVPSFQDERDLLRKLAAQVGGGVPVHILQGEYTPAELVGVYSRLALMVTTRLHAGILSARAGTPAAFIAYESNKTYGIAHMLGLDDYVTDIETVNAGELCALVERLWLEREAAATRMRLRLSRIRDQLSGYLEMTLAGIDRDRGSLSL